MEGKMDKEWEQKMIKALTAADNKIDKKENIPE